MLDSLRAFSRTWVAKIFLGVLVLSFAVFGISNVIFDLGNSTVARVGDEEISAREFQRAYSSQINSLAQQFGTFLTPEQATSMGIPSSVLNQLAADAAINGLGEDFGLGVSEDRLGKMLREDPTFAGTLGQFERQNFLRVLQQSGYTEAEYFELQTRAARRQQLASALFADTPVPATAVELINGYSADTRTIDYFVLGETSLPPLAAPTDAQLTEYLAAHQAEFRTAETRVVDVLSLSPQSLAATKTIAEEAIVAEYERTKENLIRPERRAIRQAVLPDETVAAAFEAGLASGRSFDELVAEADIPVTDLGTLARSEITDPALAEAAFSLNPGSFAVVPGVTGRRAISVAAVEPGGAITLDEAREDISNRLALAEAREEYLDILDQVEELRAAFRPLSEIAERFGLTARQVAVTASGEELATLEDVPEPERARVAQAIFAAEPERLTAPVVINANHNVWFDLKTVEPARDQTLEEVREQVTEAWTAEAMATLLAAEVEAITEQLRAGTPFADVAAARNQFPILSQPMTRAGDGTPVLSAGVAASAFAGGEGHYGAAQNEDGDYVVFQVVEIVPAPETDLAEARTFVEDAVRDTFFSDFVAGIRDAAGVRVNQQALSQILALDQTTGQ